MATLYGNTTNHWRAYVNYSTSDGTNSTTITISGAGMESVDWGFELSGNVVSTTVSLTGKSNLTGSGSFYSDWGTTVQTSYTSGSYSITRTSSAQTVTLSVTTVNSSGYMDGTSSGNIVLTIPALGTHTISYDANGGSGAPAAQTKYQGQTLVLSTTKPTYTGYTFSEWNTSANGSGKSYAPGDNFTDDTQSWTLYAIWTKDYVRPSVSIDSLYRCDSSGTRQSDGTYAYIKATWATNGGSNATQLLVQYRRSTSSSWTSAYTNNSPGASSGTIQSSSSSVGVLGGGGLNTAYTYIFRVTIIDSGGSSYAESKILPEKVLMDFDGANNRMGIGRKAATSGDSSVLDISYMPKLHVSSHYICDYINTSVTPSSYISYWALSCYDVNENILGGYGTYQNTSNATGIEIEAQRTIGSTKYVNGIIFRIGTSGAFETVPWNNASAIAFADGMYLLQPTQLYAGSGETGTVTLSESAANYDRIEIVYVYDDIYATQWLSRNSNTNGSTVNLMLMYPDSSDPTVCWIKTRLVRISGTSITTVRAANYQAGSTQGCQNTNSEIAIRNVIGYKTGFIEFS